MLNKILVANRGEIAVRILKTAREMGIGTVAVYSDVDKDALHVLSADQAVPLGDPEPSKSYLSMDKIISAAKETGAQGIHPGYGFLSENAQFAKKVTDAGLVFIGPPADVIAVLGDKTRARQLMKDNNVPIIPGTISTDSDDAGLLKEAKQIGYPVLIKAAAGGGGKGMRVVEKPDDLLTSARQASSEAKNAFGNGAVYIEKYLEKPRHVEFQILADSFGNVVHLNERECSIQRRHQKIIEETPSPALDDELRNKMGKAAVAAAKAAGYVNAGTVEFLLDQKGNFYFLEVNTRLQVEHPITEMITGLDLVRHQLNIASGEKLGFAQDEITTKGHSIECRLYAESPEDDFLPSPGRILFQNDPAGPGVRFDKGVYSGFEVPIQYDPILGKLIVLAESREAAIDRMIRALEDCVVLGVKTSIEFMIEILCSKPFRNGSTHSNFIPDHFKNWKPSDRSDCHFESLGYLFNELVMVKQGSPTQPESGTSRISTPFETLGDWDSTK